VTGAAPSAAVAVDSAASASALAAELIKEAEAGATGADATPAAVRNAQRAVTPTRPAPAPARKPTADDEPDDDWELRDMGKSAVQWVKDKMPWLRSDGNAGSLGGGIGNGSVNPTEWSQSPLEGGKATRSEPAGMPQTPDVSVATPQSGGTAWREPQRRDSVDVERNLVREAIKFIREVLEHPMTWLVISLFVVGGIVMTKVDRRPK
jgi:hypothetical protein